MVVGGGPAGSATALLCARRGLSVRLLERDHHPRRKACGEGLLPHGTAWLERHGLHPPGQPFAAIRYVFPEGLEVGGPFPQGHGLGVRRTDFDPYLLEAAQSAGVEVREGVEVTALRPHGVEASGQAFPARLVVGADGLHSKLRRLSGLDLPHRGRPRYGVTAHFREAASDEPDEVRIYVGGDHEIYTTPLPDGRLAVAALAERSRMARLKGRLLEGYQETLAQHPKLMARLAEREDEPLAIGPLQISARRAWAPGLVLVGDAAGFFDPITGEGMALALEQAELAAEAAERWLAGDQQALPLYGARARALRRELDWLTAALLFLVRRPVLARRVARNLARHPETFSALLGVSVRSRSLVRVAPRAVLQGLIR